MRVRQACRATSARRRCSRVGRSVLVIARGCLTAAALAELTAEASTPASSIVDLQWEAGSEGFALIMSLSVRGGPVVFARDRMKTMLALVKEDRGPGLTLKDVSVPPAGAGNVLIRVLKTAICGTDVHIYAWDEWAQRTVPVPLVVGEAREAQQIAAGLLERGVYAVGFFYPVVPKGEPRIRVHVSAQHEIADLDFAVEQFAAGRASVSVDR